MADDSAHSDLRDAVLLSSRDETATPFARIACPSRDRARPDALNVAVGARFAAVDGSLSTDSRDFSCIRVDTSRPPVAMRRHSAQYATRACLFVGSIMPSAFSFNRIALSFDHCAPTFEEFAFSVDHFAFSVGHFASSVDAFA